MVDEMVETTVLLKVAGRQMYRDFDADTEFGGLDQRKTLALANNTMSKIGLKTRAHLMNPMVPGLSGGEGALVVHIPDQLLLRPAAQLQPVPRLEERRVDQKARIKAPRNGYMPASRSCTKPVG